MSKQPNRGNHDWPALIAEWQGSGLTKAAFCKRRGVPASGMYTAVSDAKKKAGSGFAKIQLKNRASDSMQSCIIELPNKVRIVLNNPSTAMLRDLIK